jgi:transposase
MQLKVLLNRVHPLKSFVYDKVTLVSDGGQPVIEITVRPRANARAVCSGCGRRAPGYDTLAERRFQFIPLWGFLVFIVYAMRRVECRRCGVKVEQIPWGDGKRQLTNAYCWFLARWARRMSWSEVAKAFRTTWHHVFTSVDMAVTWGREHMKLDDVTAIGVDEICWGYGHQYATVVYQIDEGCRRLLWIGPHRTARTLLGFFKWLGKERSGRLEFVCSDMWQAYLKVIAKKAGQAVHVLDRFHIVSHLSKAIDKVRAQEVKKLKAEGHEPVLTNSRWCLLKRVENLTEGQADKLQNLLKLNLKTVRAYLLKEQLDQFWEYELPYWAGRFLDGWCDRAMRSQLDPMKHVARMLRRHKPLILNWFRAKKKFSSGVVEGLNNKAKVVTRKAYGYGTFYALQVSLYHTLGELPEPEFTHEFF